MKCSKGHIVSGDVCGICEIRLVPEKEKVTTIKKVSDKRSKELPEYSAKKKKFLEENSNCAVFPKLRATEIHHRKGKVGSLFLDERFWLGVSRPGHREIEDNPEWAYEMGYSLLRLTKIDDTI